MIKIAINDLVSFKLRKGQYIPGLPRGEVKGTVVAAVKSIWVDHDNGGVTRVSLVGGPDLAHGEVVEYDRKRFTVLKKNGGSIPTPVASDRTAEERGAAGAVAADNAVTEAEVDAAADRTLNKKERTLELYRRIMAAGGKRKEGIQVMTSEWGMSAAAASTYWQNCKSGKWS